MGRERALMPRGREGQLYGLYSCAEAQVGVIPGVVDVGGEGALPGGGGGPHEDPLLEE